MALADQTRQTSPTGSKLPGTKQPGTGEGKRPRRLRLVQSVDISRVIRSFGPWPVRTDQV